MMILALMLGVLFTGVAAGQIPGTSRLLLNRDGQSQAYSGVARFRGGGGCTASFLKPAAGVVPETAPAYVITAGHCISMQGPSNEVILDRPVLNTSVTFGYFIDTPEQQVRINAKRISYSTMKGADLAIVELDATYSQLAAKGYRPLEFAAAPPAPAEPILITGIPSRDIPPDEVFLRQVGCAHGGEASLVARTLRGAIGVCRQHDGHGLGDRHCSRRRRLARQTHDQARRGAARQAATKRFLVQGFEFAPWGEPPGLQPVFQPACGWAESQRHISRQDCRLASVDARPTGAAVLLNVLRFPNDK